MEQLAGIGSLNCLYFACLAAGGTYATIILLTGAMHDIHLPHVDFGAGPAHVDISPGADTPAFDADTGTVKVPSLSPITIASFVTAFGAFGLISLGLFAATRPVSLAWAVIGGLVIAVIAHFAFGFFLIAPQGSSDVQYRDFVGAVGEVITPIPADSVGEIAFVAQGGRITYTAKSATGKPIPRGATVLIENVTGGVAVVRLKE
jgi:hypothetical protein